MLDRQKQDDPLLPTYMEWKAQPSPKTLSPLVRKLDPVIDRALHAYGYAGDPNLRTTAQLQLIQALPRFDPAKAQLGTFAFNELRRLQRIGPAQEFLIPVPERVLLDKRILDLEHAQYLDERGREPTTEELADRTGLSTRRIEKLRAVRLPSTAATPEATADSMPGQAAQPTDPLGLWMEATYMALGPRDKQIYDWSTGSHGQPRLPQGEIARRLGVSQAAVSQRGKLISDKLQEGERYASWQMQHSEQG